MKNNFYYIVSTVAMLVILLSFVLTACAPVATQEGPVLAEVTVKETGVPSIVVEKRAIYDRNDNFIGYRFYDSELAQYCYLINGSLSCPTR